MGILGGRTVPEIFYRAAQGQPEKVAFLHRPHGTEDWSPVSRAEFQRRVRRFYYGLRSIGIQKGDRVMVMSHPRPEQAAFDVALMAIGALSVPTDPALSATELQALTERVKPALFIVETSVLWTKVPQGMKGVLLDAVAFKPETSAPLKLDDFEHQAVGEERRAPGAYDEACLAADPESPIALHFSAGTTGTPKGVFTSHRALLCALEDLAATLAPQLQGENTIFSAAPFSADVARIEAVGTHALGWTLAYASSPARALQELQEIRPTGIFATPRFLEAAYAAIQTGVSESSDKDKKLHAWAVSTGKKALENAAEGKETRWRQSAELTLARAVGMKIAPATFGGKLRFAICGGDALAEEVAAYFWIAGLPVMESYSLAEACGPLALNTPASFKLGTTGRPLPEVSLRVTEEGEVLFRSNKLCSGVFEGPDLPPRVLTAGWFATGDLGTMDEDGFLKVLGPRAEVLASASGAPLSPQILERRARLDRYIRDFKVCQGSGRFLTALVTVEAEQVIKYATEQDILFSSYADLLRNPRIQKLVQRAVDRLNKDLPRGDMIRRFCVLSTGFSVESGELSPSLKLRRAEIRRKYRAELEAMAADAD